MLSAKVIKVKSKEVIASVIKVESKEVAASVIKGESEERITGVKEKGKLGKKGYKQRF